MFLGEQKYLNANEHDLIVSFQIHLLEESSTLKISLDHQDGVWCENIVVPEMRLLRNATENDHLVISFEQKRKTGSDFTVYFSCVPKGRLHLPYRQFHVLKKTGGFGLFMLFAPKKVAPCGL